MIIPTSILFAQLSSNNLHKNQNIPAAKDSIDSSSPIEKIETSHNDHRDEIDVDSTEAVITVEPEDAFGAYITLIKKVKTEVHLHTVTEIAMSPDTVGTWTVPLSIQLSTGIYDLILRKKGFKDVIKQHEFSKEWDSLSIYMISYEHIQHNRNVANNVKWVFGGIAAIAGIASLYFYDRVSVHQNRYNAAIDVNEIQNERNDIERYRKAFRTSTGILFPAASGFTIAWIVELSL
ncbi:MAG TPA: hypothetical protein VMU30_07460 [Bacteroidota bacterium]|nr:hypothetical protein [Bacteroidota bacterium]